MLERRPKRSARLSDTVAERDAPPIGAFVPRSLEARLAAVDWLVAAGLVVLAGILRLAWLDGRGQWDADQGRDMLILLGIVRDGHLPLLGPETSIGGFHHGALWYYLLTPAAALGGLEPTWVVATIAILGSLAVGITWWLARAIGGPIAGLAAGLLMAVSATAIESSTVIWNPTLLPFASAAAFACAWHAWQSWAERWWIGAALFTAVAIQAHVLAAILTVPLLALFVADLRRRTADDRFDLLGSALRGLVLAAVTFAPLIAHELQTSFSETKAAVEFVTGGVSPGGERPPIVTLGLLVVLRTLGWPLAGVVTTNPVAVVLATVLVITALVWRARAGAPRERRAARWIGLALVVFGVWLLVMAPSLATVVPGLPVDQYHAFADPLVFVAGGLGIAGLFHLAPPHRVVATVILVAAVAFNLATMPPRIHPDGGWPGGRAAAERISRATGGRSIAVLSVPDFKPAGAYIFPLALAGHEPVRIGRADAVVVVCDRLFGGAIGRACGGPAEDALVSREAGRGLRLADRFDASPNRAISVYVE